MKLTKRIIFYIINFIVILMVTTNSALPAKLYNYKKEKAEIVNDKLVDEKILSKTYSFIKGTTVHLLDDEGELYNVPAKNAHEAIRDGYRFAGKKIMKEFRKAEGKELFLKKFRKKYRKKGIAGTGWFYHAVDQDMLSLEDRSYMTLKAEKVEHKIDGINSSILHSHFSSKNVILTIKGNGKIFVNWYPEIVPVERCEYGNGEVRISYRVDKSGIISSVKPNHSTKRKSVTFFDQSEKVLSNMWKAKELIAKFECWSTKYQVIPKVKTNDALTDILLNMACHSVATNPTNSPECFNKLLHKIDWWITAKFDLNGTSTAIQKGLVANKPEDKPLKPIFIKLSGELY